MIYQPYYYNIIVLRKAGTFLLSNWRIHGCITVIQGLKCENLLVSNENGNLMVFCPVFTRIHTHGFPPEEPGREEDSPGALR